VIPLQGEAMKDQYAGDISDVLKFAFLRALAGSDRMLGSHGITSREMTDERTGDISNGATSRHGSDFIQSSTLASTFYRSGASRHCSDDDLAKVLPLLS
jgi:hypothetical protein